MARSNKHSTRRSARRSGRRSARRSSSRSPKSKRSSKRSSRRSKKLSPYNKFMSSELKKLKSQFPNKSHAQRFKMAASNWKKSGGGN